ncbi:hypothetical protein BASA83_005305 [Batrachochytrium salamandrivorans]|nr:hypothetical protein BASA83_005305 [Batrachochytrium salamandrivorans]
MRLISFVAISFLAITVSAKPPRSPWQFSQDEVEAEIERLKAEYKKEEESFFPMDDDVKIKRQTAIVLIDGVNSIAAKLKQTDLNSYTKSELENEYRAAKAEWDSENNSDYGIQTGPSLDSFYNLGFLNDQIDGILKRIERVLAELERIKDATGVSKGDLRAQRDEVRDKIRFYKTQRDIAVKILQDYKQRQSIGARVRKFINSHLPMPNKMN